MNLKVVNIGQLYTVKDLLCIYNMAFYWPVSVTVLYAFTTVSINKGVMFSG